MVTEKKRLAPRVACIPVHSRFKSSCLKKGLHVSEENEKIPQAVLVPNKRWDWIWILPLLAIASSGWILLSNLAHQGVPITVRFFQGHGLKAGDVVKYRGIEVGQVESIQLSSDLDRVVARVMLDESAEELAREGTRFWVVRPQLDLSGPRGLETVVGAHYVNVLPGDGEPTRSFDGLDEPPLAIAHTEGGLHLRLSTPMAGGLRAGAPVVYRQVPVGHIRGVELSDDALGVHIHAVIDRRYRDWVTSEARFWKTGGATFKAGLFSGISVDVDSMQSLVMGGISMALPPSEGDPVDDGFDFALHEQPDPEWLEWTPPRFERTMGELLAPEKDSD